MLCIKTSKETGQGNEAPHLSRDPDGIDVLDIQGREMDAVRRDKKCRNGRTNHIRGQAGGY